MSALFEKTTINGLELNNRFARSATWEGMAEEDGTCTPALVQMMADFAEGQVGLIFSSHLYVTREGQATPWQLGIYKDDLIPGLKEMTDAVHSQGGKIVAQIAHAGCFTSKELTGMAPLAMSAVEGKDYREATLEDLQQLPREFAEAAKRAIAAGFDGVQLHAAHGYMLSQSLSPAFNHRTDAYGGPLESRAHLLLESLAAVRQAVGADYPVLIKINSADCLDGGLTEAESVQVGKMLQESGIDAIEVSGGTLISGALSPVRPKINTEEKEAYFRQTAKQFKDQLQVPIFLVGGVRSFTLAERLYADGVADYFSMARPFIREPHLIKRWMSGDHGKATCLSDGQCHMAARSGDGLYCVVDKKLQDKADA